MYSLTAASPDLPFGAVLMLEHNGRTVAVTVTDRGPFAVDSTGAAVRPLRPHPTRQLDLSLQAAKQLNMIPQGVASVRVWRLE